MQKSPIVRKKDLSYSGVWLHFGKMSQERVGLPQLGLQSGLLSLQGGRRLCQPTWLQSMPLPSPLRGVATSVPRSQWHTTAPPTWCSFGVSLIPSWLPHFDPSREEWSLAVRVLTPRVCTFEKNFPRRSQNFKIWMLRNTPDKNKPSFSLFFSSIWKESLQCGRIFHSHNTSRRIREHLCTTPPHTFPSQCLPLLVQPDPSHSLPPLSAKWRKWTQVWGQGNPWFNKALMVGVLEGKITFDPYFILMLL